MNDQERLLLMSEDLGVPIQVSASDGGTRRVAERVAEARLDSAAAKGSPESCISWSGWGN